MFGFLLRVRVVLLSAAILAAGGAASAAQGYAPPGWTEQLHLRDVQGALTNGGLQLAGDGRHAIYVTGEPLVAEDDNNVDDVYLLDLATGEARLASTTASGGIGNAGSSYPKVSRDGDVVVFSSAATNMVPGDDNGVRDIFVHDMKRGTTQLVSMSADGAEGDAASSDASISADGTRVAFLSLAANLVPDDTNAFADVFVRDLARGSITRVSVTDDGTQQVTAASEPVICRNGRWVAYVTAFPVVPTDTNAPSRDVYVHDLMTHRNERISVSSNGDGGQLASFYPSISADGRYVAFSSFNHEFTGYDTFGYSDSYVRDRQTGRTWRITAPGGQQPNGVIGLPLISADGRFVTANFLPTNLGWPDDNGSTDVYRWDRVTGEIDLVSRSADGGAGDAISYAPSMSDDGSLISFSSSATDLVDDPQKGPYLRHLGRPFGADGITTRHDGDALRVEGSFRAPGTVVSLGRDPATDAAPLTQADGGELTSAELVFRPETGDVLLRLDLAPWRSLWVPQVGTTAPKPNAITYTIDLDVAGRQRRISATTGPTGQVLAGYDCAAACTKTADLSGGIWMRGFDVLVAVPLGELGLRPGVTVEGSVTVTAADAPRPLDAMALDRVTIPDLSVTVAAVGPGSSADTGDFRPAVLHGGRFSASVPAADGADEAVVRTCVGEDCATSRSG